MKTLILLLISACAMSQPRKQATYVTLSGSTATNAKYIIYKPIPYGVLADTSHIILSPNFDGDYIIEDTFQDAFQDKIRNGYKKITVENRNGIKLYKPIYMETKAREVITSEWGKALPFEVKPQYEPINTIGLGEPIGYMYDAKSRLLTPIYLKK
jgi:hypothetical protein